MSEWEIIVADCVAHMRSMAAESVDSVVTDPPYLISFMGNDFDSQNGAASDPGRMQAWHRRWADEALRVLKPGAHLLAFGGTRTAHRLACAIEDAGFEIRNSIDWFYSGMPKTADVGRAIDTEAGVEPTEFVTNPAERPGNGLGAMTSTGWRKPHRPPKPVPESDEAKEWSGWSTDLKPAHEPVVVARRPLIGTVAENVLRFGTGALNIGATRVGFAGEDDESEAKAKNRHADFGSGPRENMVYGEDRTDRGKLGNWAPSGRWPPNVVLTHSPGCVRAGTKTVEAHAHWPEGSLTGYGANLGAETGGRKYRYDAEGPRMGSETVEAWACEPGCPIAELDRQGGVAAGGPSRFFPMFSWDAEEVSFMYEPRASRSERDAGLPVPPPGPDGKVPPANGHITVKPIALMRWLVRLVTPPGGLVLDPFAGSGSTGCAAAIEGFRFLGIERDDGYAEIARRRIAHWRGVPAGRAPGNRLTVRTPSVTLDAFGADE